MTAPSRSCSRWLRWPIRDMVLAHEGGRTYCTYVQTNTREARDDREGSERDGGGPARPGTRSWEQDGIPAPPAVAAGHPNGVVGDPSGIAAGPLSAQVRGR